MKKLLVTATLLFIQLLLVSARCLATPAKSVRSTSLSISASGVELPGGKNVRLYILPLVFAKRNNLDAELYQATIKNNSFSIKINSIHKPVYISLMIPSDEGPANNLYYYLAHPSDSIRLHLTNSNLHFTGRGSEKYNCQYEINKLKLSIFAFHSGKDTSLLGHINTRIRFRQNFEWLYDLKLTVLEKYKPVLTTAAYKQLRVDIIAEKGMIHYTDFHTVLSLLRDKKQKIAAILYYNQYMKNQKINVPFSEYHFSSRSYTDMLAAKAALDVRLQINNYETFDSLPRYQDVLKYYKAHFKGYIYKKLLVHYIVAEAKKTGDINSLVAEILPQQTSNLLKELLKKLAKVHQQNVDAISFSWYDTANNKFTLSDFKGKNLVINFWLYGCGFCKGMEPGMRKVRQAFFNNEDVVFLSVCLSEKPRWLKGLQSGEYTGPGSLQLFTNNKGIEDPFTKYYGYLGVPALMLINAKGKVVNTKPTRPGNDAFAKKLIAEIIEMIK